MVQTAERFFAVSAVLNNMVLALPEQPSVRLLKHIIRCYLRLSDNSRAREALRQCLPKLLTDQTFTICLAEDGQTRGCVLLDTTSAHTIPLLLVAGQRHMLPMVAHQTGWNAGVTCCWLLGLCLFCLGPAMMMIVQSSWNIAYATSTSL